MSEARRCSITARISDRRQAKSKMNINGIVNKEQGDFSCELYSGQYAASKIQKGLIFYKLCVGARSRNRIGL